MDIKYYKVYDNTKDIKIKMSKECTDWVCEFICHVMGFSEKEESQLINIINNSKV